MSSHDEEQLNEMEAMEAIYGSDYELINKEVPREYNLTLSPHTDGTENHVSCRLHVTYPSAYPAVPPLISLSSLLGLSKDQLAHLTTLAQSELSSSTGTECVMQISIIIRDYLTEHNHPQRSMFDDLQHKDGATSTEEEDVDDANASDDDDEPQEKRDARREKREAERRARRGASPLGIAPGTVVTVESFMAWKVKFDDEQRKRKEEEEKKRAKRELKLSGKQLFLANLAKELQDDEADSLVEEKEDEVAKKVFWFSEGVYDDDDVDLPDDEEDKEDERKDEEKDRKEEERRSEQPQAIPVGEKTKEEEKKGQRGKQSAKSTASTGKGSSTEQPSGKGKAQPPPSGGGKGKEVKAKGKK